MGRLSRPILSNLCVRCLAQGTIYINVPWLSIDTVTLRFQIGQLYHGTTYAINVPVGGKRRKHDENTLPVQQEVVKRKSNG